MEFTHPYFARDAAMEIGVVTPVLTSQEEYERERTIREAQVGFTSALGFKSAGGLRDKDKDKEMNKDMGKLSICSNRIASLKTLVLENMSETSTGSLSNRITNFVYLSQIGGDFDAIDSGSISTSTTSSSSGSAGSHAKSTAERCNKGLVYRDKDGDEDADADEDMNSTRQRAAEHKIRQGLYDVYYVILDKFGEDELRAALGDESWLGIVNHMKVTTDAHQQARRKTEIYKGEVLERATVQLTVEEMARAATSASSSSSSTGEGGGSISESGLSIYPLRALLAGVQWPADVDPKNREMHLSDADFLAVMGMEKASFHQLPKFKRVNKKKDTNLF